MIFIVEHNQLGKEIVKMQKWKAFGTKESEKL